MSARIVTDYTSLEVIAKEYKIGILAEHDFNEVLYECKTDAGVPALFREFCELSQTQNGNSVFENIIQFKAQWRFFLNFKGCLRLEVPKCASPVAKSSSDVGFQCKLVTPFDQTKKLVRSEKLFTETHSEGIRRIQSASTKRQQKGSQDEQIERIATTLHTLETNIGNMRERFETLRDLLLKQLRCALKSGDKSRQNRCLKNLPLEEKWLFESILEPFDASKDLLQEIEEMCKNLSELHKESCKPSYIIASDTSSPNSSQQSSFEVELQDVKEEDFITSESFDASQLERERTIAQLLLNKRELKGEIENACEILEKYDAENGSEEGTNELRKNIKLLFADYGDVSIQCRKMMEQEVNLFK